MLLDSNIIIYSLDSKYSDILKTFVSKNLYVSAISYLEVLGFKNISESDKSDLESILTKMILLEINFPIIQKATSLRQIHKMSLGDSLIASTALTHNLPLVTANVDDFKWIKELELINPLIK